MFDLPPKAKIILRKFPKYIAVITLISVLVWFGVINQYLIAVEKSRFEAATREITYFADEIKQTIAMTKETAWVNKCSYSSQKFSRGPRRCSVSLYLLYVDKSYTDANTILTKLENRMSSSFSDKVMHGRILRKEFVDPTLIPGGQRFGLTYSNEDCKDCVITINYPNQRIPGNPFGDVADNSIVLSISYGSSARAEHYPVID